MKILMPNTKVGQKVRCVKVGHGWEDYFTVGKVYEIVPGASGTHENRTIISDRGVKYAPHLMRGAWNAIEWELVEGRDLANARVRLCLRRRKTRLPARPVAFTLVRRIRRHAPCAPGNSRGIGGACTCREKNASYLKTTLDEKRSRS